MHLRRFKKKLKKYSKNILNIFCKKRCLKKNFKHTPKSRRQYNGLEVQLDSGSIFRQDFPGWCSVVLVALHHEAIRSVCPTSNDTKIEEWGQMCQPHTSIIKFPFTDDCYLDPLLHLKTSRMWLSSFIISSAFINENFLIRKKFLSLFDYPETQEVSPSSTRKEDKCRIHSFHLLAFRVTCWGPSNQTCVHLTNMTWRLTFKLLIKVVGEMLLPFSPTLHSRNMVFLLANCNPLTLSHTL